MTFGEEEKADEVFDAELEALIDQAHNNGVPVSYLGEIVAKFYRRHGRAIPSSLALARLMEMKQ